MIDDIIVMKAHCDNILIQILELKALFSHNSESITKLNKIRALTDIEMIKNSLAELEFYINDL